MAEKTSEALAGTATVAKGAPVDAGADAAPKARKAADPGKLRELIALIEAENVPHLRAGLIDQLASHKGKVTFSAGTYTARIAGISATATMGEGTALENWCQHARRALIEMGA